MGSTPRVQPNATLERAFEVVLNKKRRTPRWRYRKGTLSTLPEPDRDLVERLRAAICMLSYREREIVALRYGLSDTFTYTQREVATIFRASPATIRTFEQQAIDALNQRISLPLSELEIIAAQQNQYKLPDQKSY